MNPTIHLFHPTQPNIEVSIQHFQIIILKNMHTVSPNHTKAVQIIQSWCDLNKPNTNQEHSGQTGHHHGHEQSSLQEQPKLDLLLSKNPKTTMPMLIRAITNKQSCGTPKKQKFTSYETLERTILPVTKMGSLKHPFVTLTQ